VDRRRFLLTSLAGALVGPRAAQAQRAGKVPTIGWLTVGSEPPPHLREAFRDGLRTHGYVEGKDVIVESRVAHGVRDRLPTLAADLIRREVSVIVAPDDEALTAARQATSTIPIVTLFVLDPIGRQLITSYARPGGNVTGLAGDTDPVVMGKYLQLLKDVVPNLSHVAGLIDPGVVGLAPYRRSGETLARSMGLRFSHVEVRAASDFDSAFKAIQRQGAQAVIVYQSDANIFPNLRQLADLTTKHKLPAITVYPWAVRMGMLMSFALELPAHFRRAAWYVVEILKGANPAVLPMERPTRFELVINLKTAKALGITIPQSVLLQATQVIE
jgi:putative tryptophan/tyrosine transport system substrate-binding protein